MNMHIASITAATMVALVLGSASSGSAQVRQRYPDRNESWAQNAYGDAHRLGLRDGERDARGGRRYSCNPGDAFRAWGRGNNDRRYRENFTRGYENGYREAYDRFARVGSRDPYGRNTPSYPSSGGYGYPGTYPGRGTPGRGSWGYGSIAYDNGFKDGYEEGLKAGRGNDRFDPIGEKDYRKADHGYNNRYGSKAVYQNEYRDAFRRGYDEGYRDGRSSRNRRDGWRWPF